MSALIGEFAKRPQRAVSLHQMLQFANHLDSRALYNGSVFLRDEIPVRLAHRIADLDSMPNGMCQSPLVRQVRELYLSSFEDCLQIKQVSPIITVGSSVRPYDTLQDQVLIGEKEIEEYNEQMNRILTGIKDRHANVVETMARGVQQYLRETKATGVSKTLQQFLENFYSSRIGIRCLIGHHIALYEQYKDNVKTAQGDWVGIICKRTNVLQVIKNAVNDALYLFENKYGPFTAPNVTFHTTEKRPELRYIPSHLHHMVFELTKNSLRATYETHESKSRLPDVRIIISEGSEDITVKVSDEGGGIPRSAERLIWSFGYTTAELEQSERTPLAGFGYGLPLSRLYARYFGGDLKIISMDGFGTDAYLNLCRLPDSKEPIIQ